MSSMWFEVDGKAIERGCQRMEWSGLALIVFGVVGLLFGGFWVVFSGICVLIGIDEYAALALVTVLGGLGPMVGASVVLALGASKRVVAARLRDLKTLSHRAGGTSPEQVAQLMGGDHAAAQRLLRKACEIGAAVPSPGPRP